MGAAESRAAAAAGGPDDDDDASGSSVTTVTANGPRLVRVPGSLAGGQEELKAAVAGLVARAGGPLPGVEDRGGIELQMTHIAQEGTWDCGVACVQMALAYAYRLLPPEKEEEDIGRAALLAKVGTESIWTVDLLFLLQGYMIRTDRAVLFATTSPGVCLQYSQITYYARQFERDVARVLDRFRQAKGAGLPIYEGSLPWQTLRDLLLTGQALLVLLVDSRLLPRPPTVALQPPPAPTTTTDASGSSVEPQPPTPTTTTTDQPAAIVAAQAPTTQAPPLATGAYCGHYILLTGFRAHPPAFFYKDPARPTAGGFGDRIIDVATLDAARTSYGTDEDILVIEVPPPPPTPSHG